MEESNCCPSCLRQTRPTDTVTFGIEQFRPVARPLGCKRGTGVTQLERLAAICCHNANGLSALHQIICIVAPLIGFGEILVDLRSAYEGNKHAGRKPDVVMAHIPPVIVHHETDACQRTGDDEPLRMSSISARTSCIPGQPPQAVSLSKLFPYFPRYWLMTASSISGTIVP